MNEIFVKLTILCIFVTNKQTSHSLLTISNKQSYDKSKRKTRG